MDLDLLARIKFSQAAFATAQILSNILVLKEVKPLQRTICILKA